MAVNDRELAELRSVVTPMLSAAGRLADDPAAAERVIEAVHSGDSAAVARTFGDIGVRGLTHSREPGAAVKNARSHEYFAYQPNERMRVEICIHIDK